MNLTTQNGRQALELRPSGEDVAVTPEQAQAWLAQANTQTIVKHRRLRQGRVDTYATEMRDGRFSRSVLRFCVYQGEIYLVNGRHRLTAVVQSQVPTTFHILYDYCETEQEVRDAWNREDNLVARNDNDVLGNLRTWVFRSPIPELSLPQPSSSTVGSITRMLLIGSVIPTTRLPPSESGLPISTSG